MRLCYRAPRILLWLALASGAIAVEAHGHAGEWVRPREWTRVWSVEAEVVASLLLAAALYASGLRWLRAATGAPAKYRREARCFAAGWLVLAVALVSPIHSWSETLFAMHMTQHELLMVIAAPLIVLGKPAVVVLWAFPRSVMKRGLVAAQRSGLGVLWRVGTNVFVATLVHAAALWIWHVPVFFEATLRSDFVHALQHVSFLGSALWFWHAVFFGPQRDAGYGCAVLMLFVTAGHSGALGALITFASSAWYATYAESAGEWGLAPLEDQQLGGLIMWVPAGMIYVIAALALFAAWLRAPDRRNANPVKRSATPGAPVSLPS